MNSMKLIQIVTFLLLVVNINSHSQDIPYGVNEKAGRYCNVGDANIYYEVYGEGKPVVLLHGGFGYIDSYKKYIPILSKQFKVIAISIRGFGKSEIGSKEYSFNLLAEDVKKVIETEGQEKAILIGSSFGGKISYIVAQNYPGLVSKIITMGAPMGYSGYSEAGMDWLKNFRAEELESYRPDFKRIMPDSLRFNEFAQKLNFIWSTHNLNSNDLKEIECPVLLLYGDRDLYCTLEHIVTIYHSISKAQLAILPNSTHSNVSFQNTEILESYILKFIEDK